MTQFGKSPAPPAWNGQTAPASQDIPAVNSPRVKRVKREVFGPPARRREASRQHDPGIYPMLQLNASGQSVERCGVCLRANEHCAC